MFIMVLVKPLSKEEIRRHEALILEWAQAYNQKIDKESFQLIGNGFEKGVYKLNWNNREVVAVAANRDGLGTLLGEYNKLHHLYKGCPSLFPQPHSHYASSNENGELIIMEFLPHQPVDIFDKISVPDFHRKLAYSVGKNTAVANVSTGMYSSEPHDGNILVLKKGDNLDLRFCDASQFRQGNLEDGIRAIFEGTFRPECTSFGNKFYAGLVDGLVIGGQEDSDFKFKKFLKNFGVTIQ